MEISSQENCSVQHVLSRALLPTLSKLPSFNQQQQHCLNRKEDELYPLQFCYIILLKDLFAFRYVSRSFVLEMIL